MCKLIWWIISNQSVELIRVLQCLTNLIIFKAATFLTAFKKKKYHPASSQARLRSQKHLNFTGREQKPQWLTLKKKLRSANKVRRKTQTKTLDTGQSRRIKDIIGFYRSTTTTFWTNIWGGWIKSSNLWLHLWALERLSNAVVIIKRWKKSFTILFAKSYFIWGSNITHQSTPTPYRRKSLKMEWHQALNCFLKNFYSNIWENSIKKTRIESLRSHKWHQTSNNLMNSSVRRFSKNMQIKTNCSKYIRYNFQKV